MLSIRIHIITHKDVLDERKESVRDWYLNLPDDTCVADALKIAYVLQYDEDGSADLFRVKSCVCKKAKQLSGRSDRYALELGASRGMNEASVDGLFKDFKHGTDLDESFVRQLEDWLAAGSKPTDKFEAPTIGLKTMKFDEARSALANYYAVTEEQIQIRIVG